MIAETSLQAHEEIKPKLSAKQHVVYCALAEFNMKFGDATDQELTRYMGLFDPNQVRPRRNELVNKFKLVTFSQKRQCNITGKVSLAWRVLAVRK